MIVATPTRYIGGWRGWTVDFAAQNLRNAFGGHPVVKTLSGVGWCSLVQDGGVHSTSCNTWIVILFCSSRSIVYFQ